MESIEEGGKLVIDGLVEKEVRVQANKLWRNKGKWYLCWGDGLEEGVSPLPHLPCCLWLLGCPCRLASSRRSLYHHRLGRTPGGGGEGRGGEERKLE